MTIIKKYYSVKVSIRKIKEEYWKSYSKYIIGRVVNKRPI